MQESHSNTVFISTLTSDKCSFTATNQVDKCAASFSFKNKICLQLVWVEA